MQRTYKLENKKWLTRKTLEADNRSQMLQLTQHGRRILPELREIANRNDRRFFRLPQCQGKGDAWASVAQADNNQRDLGYPGRMNINEKE